MGGFPNSNSGTPTPSEKLSCPHWSASPSVNGVDLFHRCEQVGEAFRICSENSLRRILAEIALVSVDHLAVAVVVALQAREDDIDPVAEHA
jgi:hypothetical protein